MFRFYLKGFFLFFMFSFTLIGCATKVPNTTIVLENRLVDTSKEKPYNLFQEKEEDKYYDDAKVSKVWVDAYVTESNIRVREQFIDLFTRHARFVNTDFTPEEVTYGHK